VEVTKAENCFFAPDHLNVNREQTFLFTTKKFRLLVENVNKKHFVQIIGQFVCYKKSNAEGALPAYRVNF
jgi:hypothetical protein